MSSSSEFTGEQPSKSNFSLTCTLLSQYLKERGSFGDRQLGIARNSGTGRKQELLRSTTMTTPTMDLFPQQTGFEDVTKMPVSRSMNKPAATKEAETAPMTIFYAGQVIVFNDFPAEKAKEIMLLASEGSSQNHSISDPKNHHAFVSTIPAKDSPDSGCLVSPNPPSVVPNCANNILQNQQPHQSISCDLPIARKASLHRFLEKRKDRITSRTPYQTNSSGAPPHKQGNNKQWLGLAAQSHQ